jgi:hypothetical protein
MFREKRDGCIKVVLKPWEEGVRDDDDEELENADGGEVENAD